MTAMTEEESLLYLNSLEKPKVIVPIEDFDKRMIKKNDDIISKSNAILIERLQAEDEGLSIKDIISMKSEAFKNNMTLQGRDEETLDPRKLIPTTINIQVINN